jgi:FdrA protein
MPRQLDVRPGVYLDSVTLMQVSRDTAALDGVRSAMVAMATELNLDLLVGMGFTAPAEATPTDLLVAIDAAEDDALTRAMTAVESALSTRTTGPGAGLGTAEGGFGAAPAPRTVRAALD